MWEGGHCQNGTELIPEEARKAQIEGRGQPWPHTGQVHPAAVTRVGLQVEHLTLSGCGAEPVACAGSGGAPGGKALYGFKPTLSLAEILPKISWM